MMVCLGTRWMKWWTSRPSRIMSRERATDAQTGWVGPMAAVDFWRRGETLPCAGIGTWDPSGRRAVCISTALSRLCCVSVTKINWPLEIILSHLNGRHIVVRPYLTISIEVKFFKKAEGCTIFDHKRNEVTVFNDISRGEIFQNRRVHHFWPQKEWSHRV